MYQNQFIEVSLSVPLSTEGEGALTHLLPVELLRDHRASSCLFLESIHKFMFTVRESEESCT